VLGLGCHDGSQEQTCAARGENRRGPKRGATRARGRCLGRRGLARSRGRAAGYSDDENGQRGTLAAVKASIVTIDAGGIRSTPRVPAAPVKATRVAPCCGQMRRPHIDLGCAAKPLRELQGSGQLRAPRCIGLGPGVDDDGRRRPVRPAAAYRAGHRAPPRSSRLRSGTTWSARLSA
jgi:hypothetical protein